MLDKILNMPLYSVFTKISKKLNKYQCRYIENLDEMFAYAKHPNKIKQIVVRSDTFPKALKLITAELDAFCVFTILPLKLFKNAFFISASTRMVLSEVKDRFDEW